MLRCRVEERPRSNTVAMLARAHAVMDKTLIAELYPSLFNNVDRDLSLEMNDSEPSTRCLSKASGFRCSRRPGPELSCTQQVVSRHIAIAQCRCSPHHYASQYV